MTGKSVKDVDRYQAVLANLLLEEDNKFCADCQSKGSVSPPDPHPGGRRSSSVRAAPGSWLCGEGFLELRPPQPS